jgi:23S rRNA (uracil1939-C5)-methyltransferase
LVAGVPSIEEKLAGLTFRISPRTFFQTNTEAAELLYEAIAELSGLTSHGRVLGLYSGSGAIEIFLASKAARVTGIDSSEANIAAARENALTNGISNVSFLAGTVEKLLRNPPAEPADILIVDPPRPGLSPKALRNVAALGVPTLVYVSCNPAALARDLRELAARGYAIETIAPFDFFPHTPHLETLAVLHK